MFIEDTQLNKFIIDSNLVSKADLEIAQKEADKGKLLAESEGDGKGSTFFLELDMEV